MITSCNSTKDELIQEVDDYNQRGVSTLLEGEATKEPEAPREPIFRYLNHVGTYPTFMFGGSTGSRVATVAFLRNWHCYPFLSLVDGSLAIENRGVASKKLLVNHIRITNCSLVCLVMLFVCLATHRFEMEIEAVMFFLLSNCHAREKKWRLTVHNKVVLYCFLSPALEQDDSYSNRMIHLGSILLYKLWDICNRAVPNDLKTDQIYSAEEIEKTLLRNTRMLKFKSCSQHRHRLLYNSSHG